MSTYVFALHKYLTEKTKQGQINRTDFIPKAVEDRQSLSNLSIFGPLEIFDVTDFPFPYDKIQIHTCSITLTEVGPKILLFKQAADQSDPLKAAAGLNETLYGFLNFPIYTGDFMEFQEENGQSDVENSILCRAFLDASTFYSVHKEGEERHNEVSPLWPPLWKQMDAESLKHPDPLNPLLFAGFARNGANEIGLLFLQVLPEGETGSNNESLIPAGFYGFEEAKQICGFSSMYQDLLFLIEQDLGLQAVGASAPTIQAAAAEALERQIEQIAAQAQDAAQPAEEEAQGGFDWSALDKEDVQAEKSNTPPAAVPADEVGTGPDLAGRQETVPVSQQNIGSVPVEEVVPEEEPRPEEQRQSFF